MKNTMFAALSMAVIWISSCQTNAPEKQPVKYVHDTIVMKQPEPLPVKYAFAIVTIACESPNLTAGYILKHPYARSMPDTNSFISGIRAIGGTDEGDEYRLLDSFETHMRGFLLEKSSYATVLNRKCLSYNSYKEASTSHFSLRKDDPAR